MDLGIAGKWALVCGASRGLGFGCAAALVQEGVNVLVVARRPDVLAEAAKELRELAQDYRGTTPQVLALAADVTSDYGRQQVFAQHDSFDILVTNAGGPPVGDFRDWDRDMWMQAVDANMLTPIALIRATIDGMAERGFGRIINITSSAVKAPIDILGLSNGARSGLTGFVAGVARNPELASRNVTLNNLLPGKFDTDRLANTLAGMASKSGNSEDDVRAAQQAVIPAQRFGSPAEFGAVCAFLCSQQAGYLTGQNILLDGGAYPGTF